VNVLLHALNALLVWRVLRALGVPGALAAACVFALHPVHVESVAWITERKNVLSGAFYLAAMLACLRFLQLHATAQDSAPRRAAYWAGLLLFACALLSKTVTATLPAVLLLLIWWKRGRVRPHEWAHLAPFLVMGLFAGLLTAWLEKHHVGASGQEWNLSAVERILIAGRALWFYAGKLVWPAELTFIYPRWKIDAGAWQQYVFAAAAVAVLVALRLLRGRIGRGPLVATLAFAGTLLPVLGFFDVFPFRYSFVADHFQYLASLGLIALGTAVAASLLSHLGNAGRPVSVALSAAVLIALGFRVWQQGRIYADLETLWQDTLAKNPQAWMAHNNLGTVYEERGELTNATYHYSETLRLKPDHARAHVNLGNICYRQKDLEGAIRHFAEAVRIDPRFGEAYSNWGAALYQQGKLSEAIDRYERALAIHPDDPRALRNQSLALYRQGQVEEALRRMDQAIRLEPGYVNAHLSLGQMLAEQNRVQEAMDAFRRVLRIQPDHAKAREQLAVLQARLAER